MAHPTGESKDGALKLDFDRRLMVQFRGCVVTPDAGLLAYRELDDALGLSAVAGQTLADARTGKNGHHALVGLLSRWVFGRLAGYEDVNDAERLRHDPAMRWIVGGRAAQGRVQLHQARWGASRRNGSRHLQTSLLFPTCPASGTGRAGGRLLQQARHFGNHPGNPGLRVSTCFSAAPASAGVVQPPRQGT